MSLLTVLLPTLNCERYLSAALNSLSQQSFPDFEVLVLDGGSSDRTIEIAHQFPQLPITVVQCGPVGLGAQLRKGVYLAKGKYIARMDGDDISDPQRFERQITALEADPHLAIVGTQIQLLVGEAICKAGPLPQSHSKIRRLLELGFPAFSHPSVMFRATTARKCGGYRINGLGEDLDFYLRMTEAGTGRNMKETLHTYRLHLSSSSVQASDEVRMHYRFALDSASARRNGRPEPSLNKARESWSARGRIDRVFWFLERFAIRLYRRSRLRLVSGNRVSGLVGAGLSVLLRPNLIRARFEILLKD